MTNEKKKNKMVQEMEFSKEPAMNDIASELFSSRIIKDLEKSNIVPVDITADLKAKLTKEAEKLNAMVEDIVSQKMVSVAESKPKKSAKQVDNAIKESVSKKSDDVTELRNLLTALKEQEDEEEPVVVASTVDTPVDDENDVVQSVVSVEEPADASDVDVYEDNDIDILMSIISEFLDKIVSLEEPQEEPAEEPEEVEPEQETEPEAELEPEAGSEDEFDLDKTLSTVEHFINQVEAAKTSVDKAMEKVAKNFEDPDAEMKNDKDMVKTTEAEDADLDTVLRDIDKLEDVSDEMPEEAKCKKKEAEVNKKAPDKEAETPEKQTESYVPLPIAVNATWSPVNSSKRILEAAVKTDTVNFELIKQAHLYVEPGKENDIDAYQYPIADIIDGKLYAIPGAIKTLTDVFANDATLKALKVNENVVKEVRQKLEKYLEQLGMLIPWKEAESQEGNLKFRESSGLLSIYSTYEEFDPAMVLRKLANDNK
jgi:hypothetical protein